EERALELAPLVLALLRFRSDLDLDGDPEGPGLADLLLHGAEEFLGLVLLDQRQRSRQLPQPDRRLGKLPKFRTALLPFVRRRGHGIAVPTEGHRPDGGRRPLQSTRLAAFHVPELEPAKRPDRQGVPVRTERHGEGRVEILFYLAVRVEGLQR